MTTTPNQTPCRTPLNRETRRTTSTPTLRSARGTAAARPAARPPVTTALRERMRQDLQLSGRGERTQEAYLRAVRQLAAHFRTPPDQLSESQIRDYFLFLKNEKKFSPSSLKIAYCGIKFFYTQTAPRDWATLLKLRVPRQKTLPDVLTIDEVRRIIDATRTLHNRTYLWTVYSLGLRLQEALNLQVGDIDSARRLVHVHRGKGAKTFSICDFGFSIGTRPGRKSKIENHKWAVSRYRPESHDGEHRHAADGEGQRAGGDPARRAPA